MRTKALIKAQKRYNLNHDRIYCYLEFGTLAKIDKTGYKRQEFIKEAIKEKLRSLETVKI